MPWTTVNKESVCLRLFLEPFENFVFFDGQVIAVVHDVIVKVFFVVERPACKGESDNQHGDNGIFAVLFRASCRGHKVLDHVRDGEGCDKGHRREHHEAVALVDFDAEVARNVFENHVRLEMVQKQECENLEVVEIFFPGIVDGAEDKVNSAEGEQVVKVAEERVFEFSVALERLGHHFPVLGKVFKEVPVRLELATLESESLEVADGEERRNREERKRDKENRSLVAFLVEKFREREYDERKEAEDSFLTGLRKEGEDEGEECPMLDGVFVVGPLEYEERKCREENVERLDGHRTELEQDRRLQSHEKRREKGQERLPGPSDYRKEHEQEGEREHHELGCENPAEVVPEQRHAEVIEERKSFGLETVGLRFASESAVFEFALVAGAGFVVVVHALGDGHKDAFVALHSMASLDLRPREDGYRDGEHEHHDAHGFFGEDSLDPFPEVLTQKAEKYDSCNELHSKKREREIQIQLLDGIPVLYIWRKVYQEGDGDRNNKAHDCSGVGHILEKLINKRFHELNINKAKLPIQPCFFFRTSVRNLPRAGDLGGPQKRGTWYRGR